MDNGSILVETRTMTCPRCHTEFESARSNCPECGVRLLRNISGVIKTSAVLIAAGEKRGFYRSVQEVPEPLRARLIATTASANSGTIVIADRAGKEQLTQVMARRETSTEQETPLNLAAEEPRAATGYRIFGVSWAAWAGLLVVLTLAAVISTLFGMRW